MRRAQFIVVMGVSGSGKSTVAAQIANLLGWPLAEGDEFHSPANIAKMAAGQPLTDTDRWPWLRSIGQWMDRQQSVGADAVVTCSALNVAYRDVLRAGRVGVCFLELDVPRQVLQERVAGRPDHFMPASLLDSQLASLEPLASTEPGVRLAVTGDDGPPQVAQQALDQLQAAGWLAPRAATGRDAGSGNGQR